jgi:hypothetical protein
MDVDSQTKRVSDLETVLAATKAKRMDVLVESQRISALANAGDRKSAAELAPLNKRANQLSVLVLS